MTSLRLGLLCVSAASLTLPTLADAADRPGPNDPPPVADKPGGDELIMSVLAAHNRERSEAKLPPLSLDPMLTAAARAHADDMAAHAKMTHEGSDGSSPSDRIKRQGYHYLGIAENVAEGYKTVDSLMRGWMESPHHRENILGNYSQAGIAVARDEDDRPYWTVDFGTPIPKLDPARAADDLVKALNQARSEAGLPLLKPNPKLHEAAGRVARAFAQANSLDLKGRDEDLLQTVKRVGYRYRRLAESAAVGQPDAAEVAKTWVSSSAHKGQVLGDFAEVGVGYERSKDDTPYWCLILATPQDE